MSSATDTLIGFAADPPSLDKEIVAKAVAEQFGLTGEFDLLVSERDQNFRLTTAGGKRFVVKIVSATEDSAVTDFQIAGLLHLEQKGVTGVPRIVRDITGQGRSVILSEDGSQYCLRIVTWVSGDLLHGRKLTAKLVTHLGHRLGDLDLAFQDFTHAGDSQILLWDTQRASELRALNIHIDDAQIRRRVLLVLDDFDERSLPALPHLPRQVIHNDVNPENILLDAAGDIAGIIDFNDMLRAPRIIELSTAASYLRTENPLQHFLPLLTAYCERVALQESELDQLFDLIRARLAMTLTILYWRLSTREQGDPYREKTLAIERGAFDFLVALDALGREAVTKRFKEAVLVGQSVL